MKMNRTNTAGRILALLLTVLMVLSLAACGTKGGDKMDLRPLWPPAEPFLRMRSLPTGSEISSNRTSTRSGGIL